MNSLRFPVAVVAFATLLILAVAACSSLPPVIVAPQPTAVPVALPDNEQDCLAQGGAWGPQGLLQQDMCDLPAADAGKPCTSSSQCQGLCLASDSSSTGTCSPRTLNFGCFDVMVDGVKMGLCID
jgi:hypothetical protein